jgi:anti-sigma-K factor RskA
MHDQAAAYALDALDPEEARDFERHLVLCPGCEHELEPLRLAVAALAFAGELPPPRAALRRRVVVPRLRRRRAAPLASAAVLAACAAIVVALTGNSHARHVSFQLPPTPRGKVYEIWFVRHGMPSRAGFAHAGRNELQHVPRGAAVAVTIEPDGGSRRPTGPVILRTETA